jgi:hypothetical protein
MLELLLFIIIGIFLFFPPTNPNARIFLMIAYFVIIIVWMIVGFGPWDAPYLAHHWGK